MELEEVRKEIDDVDDEIIDLLSKRKDLIKEIGRIKKEKNIDVLDEEREKQLIERLKEKAKEKGLSEDFVLGLYEQILKNSKEEQTQ